MNNTFFIAYILARLTGTPLSTIIIIIILIYAADRVFVGVLPNIFTPIKRGSAIKRLTNELRMNPSDSSNALELGVLYFEKRRYERALEYLNKAYERIKDSDRLFLYRGMCYVETGNKQQGTEDLNQALKLNEGTGYGLPYVYLLSMQLENPNTESHQIEQLQDKFWRYANTENLYRMGMMYKRYNNNDMARQMFDNAIKEYSYCPKNLRKLHRKWAVLARLNKI